MKITSHLFFLLILLSVTNLVFSQEHNSVQQKKNFQLQLKIKGFATDYVKLLGIYGENNFGIDSVFVDASGNAIFKTDSALPGGMYLVVFPDVILVQMLIDQDQQFTLEFDKNDIINSMRVANSSENELLYSNLKFEALLNKKTDSLQQLLKITEKASAAYTSLEQQLQKLKDERKMHIKWFVDNKPDNFFTKFKLAGQNPELRKITKPDGRPDENAQIYYFRNDYWNGYDFSDERLLRTPVYFNKLKKYMLDVTPQNADSVIKYADFVTTKSKANRMVFKFTANWIAVHYKNAQFMGHDAVQVFMVKKYWTHDQAFWLKDYEIEKLRMQAKQMEVSLLGKTGQNIKGENEYGQLISLYDSKARFTIIYIFSYDCDNCKKQTPKLMKVYNEWKNKGVDVFSICIDGDREKWKAYLKQNNMTFRNIFDPENKSNFRANYYFEATPGLFVLDNNHKIIGSGIGAEVMPALFERELKK